MPPHRVSTSDYSEDARLGLAAAVTRARTAAGWPRRKDLAANADVSLRSIAKLESGETNLGWRVLEAVGRALPGWDEDTPRHVLEGGSAPAIADRQDRQAEPAASQTELERLEDDLVARLLRQRFSPERIDRALDAFRESYLDLPTVDPDDVAPVDKGRGRNDTSIGRSSDTGTG